MFQVRVHGRGGQGVVTAAELLSVAAFLDGRTAQAFPSFGSERMGAPVMAFCRIADEPIRVREPVTEPDAIVVADAGLLHHVVLFDGLDPDGYVLINSARSWDDLGLGELRDRPHPERLATVPATDIARQCIGRPLPNTCLLGALAALTGVVSAPALEQALRRRFAGELGERNVLAARTAYEHVGSVARA
ncbi:MAG: 2-oxoacid:acceptor oxidoreductase [Jatrophihabitans sp.]|nr:MAG: 2-oxoacid:acceptor oxidoreductase [Jatrophihabitans sp.]